jgi:hypothetical protein
MKNFQGLTEKLNLKTQEVILKQEALEKEGKTKQELNEQLNQLNNDKLAREEQVEAIDNQLKETTKERDTALSDQQLAIQLTQQFEVNLREFEVNLQDSMNQKEALQKQVSE